MNIYIIWNGGRGLIVNVEGGSVGDKAAREIHGRVIKKNKHTHLRVQETSNSCSAGMIGWKINLNDDDDVSTYLRKDNSREKLSGTNSLSFPRIAAKQQQQDIQRITLFDTISPASSSRHLHPFFTSTRKLGVNIIIHGVISDYQNACETCSFSLLSFTDWGGWNAFGSCCWAHNLFRNYKKFRIELFESLIYKSMQLCITFTLS